ncbi:MAG: protease pro-enzyme activation domain-containing protein [Candidatus Thermoplasmatota archaeon]|nr:protease pro-enzyme activation domain-containing protein [Candidatus Thermoplasmatota archaeon]
MKRFFVILLSSAVVSSLLMISPLPVQSYQSAGGTSVSGSFSYVTAEGIPNFQNCTLNGIYGGQMNVVITFHFTNNSLLSQYLSEVSNPLSPYYGHYISRKQFVSMFEPSATFYNRAVTYLESVGNAKITTYSDRALMYVSGDASYFSSLFHSQIAVVSGGGRQYYSPVAPPMLPTWLSQMVCGVIGLSNVSHAEFSLGHETAIGSVNSITNSTFPSPLQNNGNQILWGSDMQVAYDEVPLLEKVIPKNSVEATILWSGYDSNASDPVGPFYPNDIYAYFNESIPSGEPHAKVYGVPLDGAPPPGISASYDTTGASFENTLDLEMMGSLAPGSSIYNVYSESNQISSLVNDFAYILNPNSSFSQLLNVSVISNSWYGNAYKYPSWDHCVETANALGITVLAASGDSGDNVSSKKYVEGSFASFPGNQQNNTYGMISVGGTTVQVCSVSSSSHYLDITNESAWFMLPAYSNGQGTVGTQGGICQNVSEPYWEEFSIANRILNGSGLGVPDIGAIANNTVVFITVEGTSYYDNPDYYIAWGTSIASPVEAGIIAEIDAYLQTSGHGKVGFLDPSLFDLGNLQYDPEPSNFSESNHFLNPFYDIDKGRNSLYEAQCGYDLLTGLGSINAFNLTYDLMHNFTHVELYSIGIEFNLSDGLVLSGQVINNFSLSHFQNDEEFFLANGTYNYNVTLENSTGTYYAKGYFIVNGKNETFVISLNNITKLKTISPVKLNLKSDLIVFLLLVLIILGILAAVMRRRS